MDENDPNNTICQRQIDVEKYLSKNFDDRMPKGYIYDKYLLVVLIRLLNMKLLEQDMEVRKHLFDRLNKWDQFYQLFPNYPRLPRLPRTIHNNIPAYYYDLIVNKLDKIDNPEKDKDKYLKKIRYDI